MIIRGLSILVALAATLALWYGYTNLNELNIKVLRGTDFYNFRYVIFTIGAFLGLSVLEAILGWIKSKTEKTDPNH